MSVGKAAHLYDGAMSRGRSERTLVALGLDGLKGSSGHESDVSVVGLNVGVENAAELVCCGSVSHIILVNMNILSSR